MTTGSRDTSKSKTGLYMEIAAPLQELHPDPEIETQLDRAFANPRIVTLKDRPKVSPEDIRARELWYARQREMPKDIKITFYENPPQLDEVWTRERTHYPLLLAQALRRLELIKGEEAPELAITPSIEKAVKHEGAHGAMAAAFGLGSRYGVSVLHDPAEDIWSLGPFHALIGDSVGAIMLTKLEQAAISVAPEDASPSDLQGVYAAGFTSREEVLDQLYDLYPHLCPDDMALPQAEPLLVGGNPL